MPVPSIPLQYVHARRRDVDRDQVETTSHLVESGTALDAAAHKGFTNGTFEELEEDVPAVVEEFYPEAGSPARVEDAGASGLRDKLEARMASIGAG